MKEGEERKPGGLAVWWLAARPKTLWAASAPVVIGGALALETGKFHAVTFLAVLAGALFIQVGTNFANDLFDHLKAADDSSRLGPRRATASGWVTPSGMKAATVIAFGLAAVIGIFLVFRGGLPILVIGLLSILFGVIYTGGPLPLGYLGLGDIFVLVFFGPVAVAGTSYVITLDFNTTMVLAGVPAGMLSTAILTVNNLRDIETDGRCGKKTLAVRFGPAFARAEYFLMVVGGIVFPLLIVAVTGSHVGALLGLLALIPAYHPVRKVISGLSGPPLNEVLASTGRILAIYALLFSIGWQL